MSGRPELLGAVLAGGESRRLGSDKALEPLGGVPLVARAASTLALVFDQVVVVSSRALPSAALRGAGEGAGWTRVPDLRDGCGPLAGVEAALAHAAALDLDGAFVLACDLPFVDADVVEAVVRSMGDASAAAPERRGTPDVEPLCASYRVECLAVVQRLLDAGERAVHRAFEEVSGVRVPVAGADFLNVNTPEDRDRMAATLREGDR